MTSRVNLNHLDGAKSFYLWHWAIVATSASTEGAEIMKNNTSYISKVVLLLLILLWTNLPLLQAQTGCWVSRNSGFCEDTLNSSAGLPGAPQSIFITNCGLPGKNSFI